MNRPVFLQTAVAFQYYNSEISDFFKKQKLYLNANHVLLLETLQTFGMLTQQEIANKLEKDKSSINRFIGAVLPYGFISVSIDTKDRRKHIIKITEAGKSILQSLFRA